VIWHKRPLTARRECLKHFSLVSTLTEHHGVLTLD
jgi:hypothetical protein